MTDNRKQPLDEAGQLELKNLIGAGGADWQDSAAIAEKLYFTPGLRQLACSLISANPKARDYLTQCPSLLLALAHDRVYHRADYYALLAKQFAWRADAGPKLKDLMRHFELPYPMRKISGRALTPQRYWAMRMIASCDPRVIASSIPEKVSCQAAWLRGAVEWRNRLAGRQILPMANVPSARIEWFIFAYARLIETVPYKELQEFTRGATIATVIDFVGSHEVRNGELAFDQKWTWGQAKAAAERWHTIINAAALARSFKRDYGITADSLFSMAPFPDVAITVDGFEFHPLNSGHKVSDQATEMHNCLRSYMGRIVGNTYKTWAVHQPGNPQPVVATLGMVRIAASDSPKGRQVPERARWRIDQIEGRRHHRQAAPEVHAACKQFYRTAF